MSPPAPDRAEDCLRRNLRAIRARIEAARAGSPHGAAAVTLVVVTKSIQPPLFAPLWAAGARDVGENRVQSARRRRPLGPSEWTWHGIGHLQRNKAAAALEVFDCFHALDSARLAHHLEARLQGSNRRWPVYLQVNAGAEAAKGGLAPEAALDFLREVGHLTHLDPVGFMTLARVDAAQEDLRATFRTLRHIRDEGLRLGVGERPVTGLSMGMSDDFETAVEEGATVVRVGRAVFCGVDRLAATPAHEGGAGEEHE